ncbi:MAG: serine/threonine protein kinase [Myxococcales bacterium]|nr:serine/threonine protein kinase [Myxococcales bacterium]
MATIKACLTCKRSYLPEVRVCQNLACSEHGKPLTALEPAPAAAVPPSGTLIDRVLGGRYRLTQRLGEGGWGVVYKGVDQKLDRLVAVKLISNSLWRDTARYPKVRQECLARFEREARIMTKFSHPHIVSIHDYGKEALSDVFHDVQDRVPYIVMEFLEGETLHGRINRGELSVVQAVRLAIQIAEGLVEVHAQGIWHRDLKPENIFLVTQDGQPEMAKLMDFGVSRLRDPSEQAYTTWMVGTAAYSAPERFSDPLAEHPKSDCYALGLMLYEMLSKGRHAIYEWHRSNGGQISIDQLTEGHWRYAHQNAIPASLRSLPDSQVSEALDKLVLRLLGKDPAQRPSAMELLRELIAIQAQLPAPSVAAWILLHSQRPKRTPAVATPSLSIVGAPVLAASSVAAADAESSWRSQVIEFERTVRDIEHVEPQLQTACTSLQAQSEALAAGRWGDKLSESLTTRLRGLHELNQRIAQQSSRIETLKAQWQEDRAQAKKRRDQLLAQRYLIDCGLADSDAFSGGQRDAIVAKQVELDWQIQAIKTDSRIIEELFKEQLELHNLRNNYYHRTFQFADKVLAGIEADPPGLIARLWRPSPEHTAAKTCLETTKPLLEQLEKAWRKFPELHGKTETYRAPSQ